MRAHAPQWLIHAAAFLAKIYFRAMSNLATEVNYSVQILESIQRISQSKHIRARRSRPVRWKD